MSLSARRCGLGLEAADGEEALAALRAQLRGI
jgi:hypothetical protein